MSSRIFADALARRRTLQDDAEPEVVCRELEALVAAWRITQTETLIQYPARGRGFLYKSHALRSNKSPPLHRASPGFPPADALAHRPAGG